MFAENTEYEILTPSGWKDFRGITFSGKKVTYRIELKNGRTVDATEAHFFFNGKNKIQVNELKIFDYIETSDGFEQIISIKEQEKAEVYDIIEVEDELHRFLVNDGIVTKNCDEFAFVRPTIAQEFWTSITPTLATGGKAIITSTPNSDEDQFALIWKGANKTINEYGETTELGINGFKAFRSYWQEHPERDEAWAVQMRAQLGDDRFKREIECFTGDTKVTVRDKQGKEHRLTILELEKMLSS